MKAKDIEEIQRGDFISFSKDDDSFVAKVVTVHYLVQTVEGKKSRTVSGVDVIAFSKVDMDKWLLKHNLLHGSVMQFIPLDDLYTAHRAENFEIDLWRQYCLMLRNTARNICDLLNDIYKC